MAQTVTLTADVSLGTWSPSGGVTGAIVLSDSSSSTKLTSPASPDLATYRGRFTSASQPVDNNGHILRLTCRRASGTGGWLIAKVYSSGGTLAATLSTQATITTTLTQIDIALTSGQAATAGYASVEVEIIANQNGFGSTFEVSEARLLLSDAIVVVNFNVSDTVAFSNTLTLNLGKNFAVSDTVVFSETVTINVGFFFSTTSDIIFSENVTLNLTKNFNVTGTITFSGSDALQVAIDVYFALVSEMIFSNRLAATFGPAANKLLTDPDASRFFYADFTYYDRSSPPISGVLRSANVSEEGRQLRIEDARTELGTDLIIITGLYYEPRIIQPIIRRMSMWNGTQIAGNSKPSFGNMIISNNIDVDGNDLDNIRMGRIEQQTCYIGMGGRLSDGTYLPFVQNLTVFNGNMSINALAGEETIELVLQDDQWKLEAPISTRRFQGGCVQFLVNTDTVNFGDVLDRSGDFGIEFWVWINDVTVAATLVAKDTVTGNGWGVQVGVASNPGGIRFFIREVSGIILDTASNIVFSQKWHRISVFYSHTTQTKYIYIDKTLITSAAGLTGNVAGNSASFVVGGFVGKIDDIRVWSSVRALSDIKFNTFLEMAGNEVGLDAYFPMNDRPQVNTIADVVTPFIGPVGTFTGTTTWDLGDWCDPSLINQAYPVCYGCPGEISPVLVDPFEGIWMFHDSPSQLVVSGYDKGVLLTVSTNYTVELARSLVKNVTALVGAFTLRVNGDKTNGVYTNSISTIIQAIIVSRTPCSVNSSDVSTLAALWSGEAGFYRDGKNPTETISTVLDELCAGPLFAFFPDVDNFIRLVAFSEPTDALNNSTTPPDFYITDDNITSGVTPIPQEGPVWAVNVAYDQNQSPMTPNDAQFLLPASAARYKYVTEQYRFARKTNLRVLKDYPNTAREITIYSSFTQKVDADSAASIQLGLFSYPHEMYKLECDLSVLQIYLNNVCNFQYHALGLDDAVGANFRVIDMETDGDLEKVTISVWGRKRNP